MFLISLKNLPITVDFAAKIMNYKNEDNFLSFLLSFLFLTFLIKIRQHSGLHGFIYKCRSNLLSFRRYTYTVHKTNA